MDKDPITNPEKLPWMRRSQNLMEHLEIEEVKDNSINEWRPDELDHNYESSQPKFTQFSQIKSIQSRPNIEFSQTSSSPSSPNEFSQSKLDELSPTIKSRQCKESQCRE